MMITISTGGCFLPHQALALHLNAWLYLMASSTACTALLKHAIAESGTWSALMVNYVNNGKWQERAADDTCHLSMHECTSRHCWQHALHHSGTQLPNRLRSPCWWQITSTTAIGKSGWWTSPPRLDAWLYLTALLTACVTPLGHVITKSGTRSVLMAENYEDNDKQQELAADNAAAVQC
jgi:hypothetical protein